MIVDYQNKKPIMFTPKELSERYDGKISVTTIYRLLAARKIRSIRLSPRKLMIPLSEIEKYERELLEESSKPKFKII